MIRFLIAFVSAFATSFAQSNRSVTFDSPEVRAALHQFFTQSGPRPGQPAPTFTLKRSGSGEIRTDELWQGRPAVIMTGSYSCPIFRASVPAWKALVAAFADRVNFVTIYVIEAHPSDAECPYTVDAMHAFPHDKSGGVPVKQPVTDSQRMRLARECRVAYGLPGIIAVDKMDNAVWTAYGSSPNCCYLVDKRGIVNAQQGIFDAQTMRAAIERTLARD